MEQMVEKGGSRERGTKGSEALEERGRRRQEESAGKGSVEGARGAAGAENTPGAGIGLRCLPSLLLGPPSACFSPPSSLSLLPRARAGWKPGNYLGGDPGVGDKAWARVWGRPGAGGTWLAPGAVASSFLS